MAPEIPYVGEVPIVPNVRPVIVVTGSDFDMGYQHNHQIVQVFGPFFLNRIIQEEYSKEQREALKAYQWHLRKYTPELIDYIRGMAAGARDAGVPLSYYDVLADLTANRMFQEAPEGSEDETLESECSGFAAWGSATTDGSLVCGGSGDHDLIKGYRPEYTIIHFPETGYNFICSPPTGGACHPGMNNRGVAFVHHGCTGYLGAESEPEDRDWGYGVPKLLGYLHTLRWADSAEEAMETMLSMSNDVGGLGGTWADVNGYAYDIENRENPRCIRRPGDHDEVDFIYSTNNLFSGELSHAQRPPPEGNVFVPHAGWLGTGKTVSAVTRNLQLWNMLHHYHGEVDVEFAKMMFRFPGEQPSYPTLEEAEEAYYPTKGAGWHQKISTLENAMVGVLKPDDGDDGDYYVSHGSPARLTSPLVPGGHYYRVAPTYSFFKLKLASSPRKVAEAAKRQAQLDQYYANVELRQLDYWDPPYVPLDKIFDEAAVEWQKGEFYRTHALETAGNESIFHWGRAIRAYTRCQALASHVYNALVPPPDSPEDLGLRPWMFWSKE